MIQREEPQTPDTRWRRTLYIMWLAEFVATSGISLVMPFLPLYVLDLGVDDPADAQRWAGFLIAANFISSALMAPVWGWLGDRYGRKKMVLRAIFGLSVAIGLMGFVRTPQQLLALRLLQGAVGGFVSASVALVASATPKKHLGYALGMLQTASTSGHVIGPLFGGLLADRFGYAQVFLITGATCVVAGIIVTLFVHEKFTPVAPEKRVGMRETFSMLLTLPALRATFGIMFITQIGLMTIQPILALFVQSLEQGSGGMLRTKVGLIFAMPGLASIVAAPLWGRRGDRVGHRHTLAIALLGAGILYLPHYLVRTVAQMMVIRFSVGLCTAGILPAAHSVVASAADPNRTAGALSLLSTARWLGSIAGPLMGGYLSAHFGIRPMFMITGALLLTSGLSAWHAAHRTAAKANEP
ncbi:MAG TPA: MFS transporter [Armatimonadota bacterium]|nr:MFS transporter [Armatimonadota bacterium]